VGFYLLRDERFCFNSKWIKWIKGCLISLSLLVLVNGNPTSEFIFDKGLRQGDPLPPFLFFIVVEGSFRATFIFGASQSKLFIKSYGRLKFFGPNFLNSKFMINL